MNTKHTAGQWEILIQPTTDGTTRTINVGSKRIATLEFMETIEESEANAKLISAAPKLLEALKDIIHADKMNMGKSAKDLRIEIAAGLIDAIETELV